MRVDVYQWAEITKKREEKEKQITEKEKHRNNWKEADETKRKRKEISFLFHLFFSLINRFLAVATAHCYDVLLVMMTIGVEKERDPNEPTNTHTHTLRHTQTHAHAHDRVEDVVDSLWE